MREQRQTRAMANYALKDAGPKQAYMQNKLKLPLIPPASIRSASSSSRVLKAPERHQMSKSDSRQERRGQSGAASDKLPAGSQVQVPSSETWPSIEQLFKDHMREVQNKWSTLKLNDDIWAKLIYFEQNRRLAKAYVSAPVLTIDGSTSGLDGFRIGLSGIDNRYRSLESIGCLRSIGQGIKLKIDSQGNILIKKIGDKSSSGGQNQCSIWVKDWPTTSSLSQNGTRNDYLANSKVDNSSMREIDYSDTSFKLFDMRKFRLLLERNKLERESQLDWRQCVSIISFVKSSDNNHTRQAKPHNDVLDDPCWIMLINIIAIDMLKSSIYSADNLLTRCNSSSLIQNHSLLHQEPSRRNNNGNFSHPTARQRSLAKTDLLQTSSSASTLYPSAHSSASMTRGEKLTSPEPLKDNLASTNSTDKQHRAHTARYRSSCNNKTALYQRRYQSIQQLSANNTIYTTFNSKFINSRPLNSLAPNEFKHSTSRSSSSSYWQLKPSNILTMGSMNKENYVHSNDYEKYKLSYRPEMGPSELAVTSRSLSVFDLSNRKPQIDLRKLQTSIKMNYDQSTEDEERFDDVDEDKELDDKKPPSSTETLQQVRSRCKCNLSVAPETINKSPQEGINHHECEAVHGRVLEDLTSTAKKQQQANADRKQKASRSSIASSSSSSGCIDNDYFMSQSSSSMSSSTASHDREQLSQPASSSGIGYSGSMSDEYEEKIQVEETLDKCATTETRSRRPREAKELRGHSECKYKLDSYKTNNKAQGQVCSCDGGAIVSPDSKEDPVVCDYQPTDTFDCECCDCDCISLKDQANVMKLESSEAVDCNCQDESIYDILPVQTHEPVKPKALANHEKPGSRFVSSKKTKHDFCSSPSGVDKQVDQFNLKASKTVPMRSGDHADLKESKHSGSWLERKKYCKILPKFMFSSSISGSGSSNASATSSNGTESYKLTALSGV